MKIRSHFKNPCIINRWVQIVIITKDILSQNLKHFFSDYFDIDATSGEIRSVTILDAEIQEIYKFSAIVLDDGFPSFTSTLSVTIFIEDINDHSPVLSSTNYFAEIKEGYYPDYFDIQLVSLYHVHKCYLVSLTYSDEQYASKASSENQNQYTEKHISKIS